MTTDDIAGAGSCFLEQLPLRRRPSELIAVIDKQFHASIRLASSQQKKRGEGTFLPETLPENRKE
jgi:hypothetical protein